LIQFVQDKVSLLDNINAGDEVRIQVNLRGREWINPQGETVYFNTIQGWKIEKIVAQNVANSNASSSVTPPPQSFEAAPEIDEKGEEDDLPF